jgi:AmpD protein
MRFLFMAGLPMLQLMDHLLLDARQVPSPNFNQRPVGCVPELLVIHCISLPRGEYGGTAIEELFTNRLEASSRSDFASLQGLRVSAHVLIRRDGELVQFVPFNLRAWHAGHSEYQGRTDCNDFSIGIELEGTDDSSFEPVQYEALVALVHCLCRAYPSLSLERIVGHADIAPGRKTDPGSQFDWWRLDRQLRLGPSEDTDSRK